MADRIGTATDGMSGVIERVDRSLAEMDELELAHEREYPAADPARAQLNGLPIKPEIKRYLANTFPEGLFTHQHAGLAMSLAGQHTVVSTRTSSGKSLIFTVPSLNAYLHDPDATTLFIYPQKALANDQLHKMREAFESVTGEAPGPALIARYDGATPKDGRPAIRDRGQFVLTNPDMLHYGILQHHEKWRRFFSQLRYVVVDEAHAYRGMFGTSVAYILRRLRCICEHYGRDPVFISASATMDSPSEHLRNLTGLSFAEVDPGQDGSVQGRRKLWLLRGTKHIYHLGRTLTRSLVDKGLHGITFCASRVVAERLVAELPESDKMGGKVRVYRAGLRAEEREEIEAGLKTGEVQWVFSTSALELGVDIGLLDAAICVGLPNTMMSLWQRAGRVGRNGKEGAIVFLAADTPLDTYFTEHPKELFDRDHEPLAINLQNKRLVCHHLACSLHESGDEDAVNTAIMGPDIDHALALRNDGRLSAEVFYADDPHMRTPVRSTEAHEYTLLANHGDVGEIDAWHLIRETYPHGIYRHGGRQYRVVDIFRSKRQVRLVPDNSRNDTNPVINVSVYTRNVREVTTYSRLVVKLAGFDVTERLVSVVEKNRSGKMVRKYEGSQGLAPHRLPTEGVSIEVLPELTDAIDQAIHHSNRPSVVHAIERLIHGLFPVIAGPCDTMDYSTFCDARGQNVTWYLYDQVHDGIDLTTQAYPRVAELFAKALDRVESCDCGADEGCFRCIRNPNADEATSKADCVAVLELLCDELSGSSPKVEVFESDGLEDKDESRPCPTCKASVKPGDRFCRDCGEKLEE